MILESSIESPDDPRARARWHALWETSPQRSPYSTLAYAELAARAYGLRLRMHFVVGSEADEAGALITWHRRGPWRVACMAPFTQYSALLLRTELPEAAVHARNSALDHLLAALEQSYHRHSLMADLKDVRPASWRGWHVEPLYTYRLNPKTAQMSEGTRRTFKKHDAEYLVSEDPHGAPQVVSLCAKSYARKGRSLPADSIRLTKLASLLQAHNLVRIFIARRVNSTEPEAGVAFLCDSAMAHYWIAGSKPGPAMTVLLGRALPRLWEAGIAPFDFTGANTPSIAEFKRRFGGHLSTYYHLRKTMRPELRLLDGIMGRP